MNRARVHGGDKSGNVRNWWHLDEGWRAMLHTHTRARARTHTHAHTRTTHHAPRTYTLNDTTTTETAGRERVREAPALFPLGPTMIPTANIPASITYVDCTRGVEMSVIARRCMCANANTNAMAMQVAPTRNTNSCVLNCLAGKLVAAHLRLRRRAQ